MEAVRKTYASLDSYSATLVHHDDSGLFPGDYTQELKWRKGGRFELTVKKPSKVKVVAGKPGQKAPNYYASGSQVVEIWPNKRRTESPLEVPPNMSPGWEVSGGPVMGWLQATPVSDLVLNPPSSITAKWSPGTNTTWQGENVREILLNWSAGAQTTPVSFYLSPDGRRLIGYAFTTDSKTGWVIYKDQKLNPTLPDTLGTPPK
jgi:hypothetical protein